MIRSKKAITGMLFTVILAGTFVAYVLQNVELSPTSASSPESSPITASSPQDLWIETFPPGTYKATIIEENTAAMYGNPFGWYTPIGTVMHNATSQWGKAPGIINMVVLFSGEATVGSTVQFTVDTYFGFWLNNTRDDPTIGGLFYTENWIQPDPRPRTNPSLGNNHALVDYVDPLNPCAGYIIRFEDWIGPGSNWDYNDMVVKLVPTCYWYKVKFECGWQREVIQPCHECVPSQRIPVETLIETQINVYNPNNVSVEVTKYFAIVFPEIPELMPMNQCHCWTPYPGDGRTCHIHIMVPGRKGFEIDCEDVVLWSLVCPDPTNPVPPLNCTDFFKGFVIIGSPSQTVIDNTTVPLLPLEVVAVYNKESADMVDKITFHTYTHWCNYIDTRMGRLKLHEPHELSVVLPFEPANITLPELVKRELGIVIPFEPEDVDIEIVHTTTYFDFLECVTKKSITFIPRATSVLWRKALDQMWPVEERPPDWEWPSWIWPCKTYEMKKHEKFCKPWQEVIVDPEANIRDYMRSTLIDMGVPPEIVDEILRPVVIEILDIDVGKGVGTSIDVEYIEPEIIDP